MLEVEVSDAGAVATYPASVLPGASQDSASAPIRFLQVEVAGAAEHAPMLVAIAQVSAAVQNVSAQLGGASDSMAPVAGWAVLAAGVPSPSTSQVVNVSADGSAGVLESTSVSEEPSFEAPPTAAQPGTTSPGTTLPGTTSPAAAPASTGSASGTSAGSS